MEHKIVFAGPSGSGKTTAIATVCGKAGEGAADGAQPSANLGYGVLDLGGGECLHLYSTSGEQRFDDILTRDAIGLILLLDNTRPDPIAEMRQSLRNHEKFIRQTKVAIGVTHFDAKETPSIDEFARAFYKTGFRAPVFQVDARQRADIVVLLQALLFLLDPAMTV